VRIYETEKADGINFDSDQSGNSSSFVTAQVQLCDHKKRLDDISVSELIESSPAAKTVEELLGKEHPDLALIVSVLVSTGWNRNDDIFTPEEVWRARFTPAHKPMNDCHKGDQILGHIVQTRVLDKSGNEVNSDTPPAEFDIEVAGVLYKWIPELTEKINDILDKAKSGTMFVSMECLFPDFGYGLIDPSSGETKLIERTEATAFLTKHLRLYGGSGKYQGYQIGRVLKDIIFSAQGFTDDPANPESVIKVAANRKVATNDFVTAQLSELLEGGVEDVDKAMEELQKKLEAVQATLADKDKELTDLRKVVDESKTNDYEGQIAALNAKVEELTANVEETSKKAEDAEAAKAELQKQFDEVSERADKSDAELGEIRKTEAARERMAKLSEVKKIDDEEATLAELRDMSDETFEAVMKYAGGANTEEVEDTDASKEKEAEAAAAAAAEAALDNAEEDKDDADLNASEDAKASNEKRYLSVAMGLCGQETKKDEGGE
jgi:hypothetical protein